MALGPKSGSIGELGPKVGWVKGGFSNLDEVGSMYGFGGPFGTGNLNVS